MMDKLDEFEYVFEQAYTRVSLKADAEQNVWFGHGPGDEQFLLVHEPGLSRSIHPDGTGVVHWSPAKLAQHIAVCQEALAQLDFHITAQQEMAYDAYCSTLKQDEDMDNRLEEK